MTRVFPLAIPESKVSRDAFWGENVIRARAQQASNPKRPAIPTSTSSRPDETRGTAMLSPPRQVQPLKYSLSFSRQRDPRRGHNPRHPQNLLILFIRNRRDQH